MKFMMKKKSGKGKAIGWGAAATTMGGLALAWGFRMWSKRGRKGPTMTGGEGTADEELGRRGSEDLAENWHGLDEDERKGHIPRALERDPKNIEETIHSE